MTAAIAVADLVKTFGGGRFGGGTRALDGLTLSVDPGEVHGFLGPNGSGKSTTIRILLGLLRKDSGSVRLLGRDPVRDAVALHRRLAYVPGDVNLWPNLTGGESIDLFGRLRGGLDPARRAELVERFELDPTKKCRTYSKGNRQKIAIIAAFASNVELYILDEPTSGLDPLMEAAFQDCVRQVRADGRTVLLSSHVLAEVEALCDRVSIIRSGRTVESGTLSDLRHLTRTTVSVTTRKPVDGLAELPGVHNLTATDSLETGNGRARFEVEPGAMEAVLAQLTRLGVIDMTSVPPTLEELFLRHYTSAPSEAPGSSEAAAAGATRAVKPR